jgi:hypothetical protein
MKKLLFLFLLLLFPFESFAQLDVYLSSENLSYGKDIWTSANYPDSGSSELKLERYFFREEFPPEYQKTPLEIQDLIDTLFPGLTA